MVYKVLNNITEDDKETYSKEEVQNMLEELSIYQSELEAQNSELIEKDKQLLDFHKEFNLLFNDAPVPFLLLNKELEIKKYNYEADRYFELSSVNIPIKSIFRILKDHNIEAFIQWVNGKNFIQNSIELDMLCVKKNINRFKINARPYSLEEDWIIISLIDLSNSG